MIQEQAKRLMRAEGGSKIVSRKWVGGLALMMAALLLVACETKMSDVLPDRKVEYKKQRVAEEDLEIPPDLSSDTIVESMPVPGVTPTATYSEYEEQKRVGRGGSALRSGGTVLPEMNNVRVVRDGDQRWLEINASPDEVWPRAVSFWRENGVLLVEQDPTVGVMKTDWLENRADIKQGMVTELLRKAFDGLYSAATRDQFRVRLEPGEAPGTTDLYLTHRGMEEKLATTAGGDTQNSYWVPRPTDPGLEAEMLRRMMLYLGVAEKQAASALTQAESRTRARSQMIKAGDGSATLLVEEEFAPAWRLVGVALERVGFAVEDRDRSAGEYYVRYDDPTKEDERGFMSKLAFWRDEEKFDEDIQYRIRLQEDGSVTRVVVLNSTGERELSDTGVRILTLIQEQIR
jgi:outer membrane protein assembly factor BamC